MNKATVTAKAGEPIMTIERIFDAPLNKVFAALTQKDKLEKWWVGPDYEVRIEQIDARDGGSWRFVQTDKEGMEFVFFGTFHEVTPERIIQTSEFSMAGQTERGHVALEKMELIEEGNNRTKLLATSAFLDVTDRDNMIKSGMEEGMNNTYAKLDELLKEMK